MLIVLVTLYNKNITDSKSIQSLLKGSKILEKSKIIIWDNSENIVPDSDLNQLSKALPLTYIHSPENLYLSSIYNKVAYNIEENDYLLILDDDSTFSKDFLIKIYLAIYSTKDINLFLPTVEVKNQIVSPAYTFVIKNSLLNRVIKGYWSSKNLTAINSGMVISGRVFKDGFCWDSRLKFYGTDNYFMYKFRKKYKKVFILDSSIHHDLAFNSSSIEKKAFIFRETKKSNYIIFQDNKLNLLLVIINNIIVSSILGIRYKSFKFFK